jgi:hypothetical protein
MLCFGKADLKVAYFAEIGRLLWFRDIMEYLGGLLKS